MNYTEIKGDLIEAFLNKEVDVIAHQVNCFGIAKSGIAVKIFEALPWLAESYFSDKRPYNNRLGKLTAAKNENQWGFNLCGQFHHEHSHPAYKTHYAALYLALKLMASILKKEGAVLRVGFPLLGCGLAGGDWDHVSENIKRAFSDTDFEIIVYRFEG